MSTPCDRVTDDLSALVDGDRDAIARHADHLAGCDHCRDARHEATLLAERVTAAGADYIATGDLVGQLMAQISEPEPEPEPVPASLTSKPARPARRGRPIAWAAVGAALAASAAGIYVKLDHRGTERTATTGTAHGLPDGAIGSLTTIARAAADRDAGVSIKVGSGDWRPLHAHDPLAAGATVRTDERTRATFDLADGTHLVLDHQTELAFDANEPRHMRVASGRLLADVTHIDGHPAQVATPTGVIDVVGTRFVATAAANLTAVQVVRGQVVLRDAAGDHQDVRAGEEGSIDGGAISVAPVPSLARDVEWAEQPLPKSDDVTAGVGSLRAYKPGETRDRDWNLALANHDVKVRIVGPIARTEISETFRNDSATELEGVYQFPLPADAQIDGLALDQKDAPDGFADGAFVDKERGAKIWKGVIQKAAPQQIASNNSEIIWVPGSWRDPALLDWKRGGRFELRVFPIPPHGQRTIKLAYTEVVAPHGNWRQYVYPLPHSSDGSTVADKFSVDVEVRGAAPGLVRAAGYDLKADPARQAVGGLVFEQGGFVPRGDLVIAYRPADAGAELRAWTFAGGAAVAPDDKLAEKHGVGIDPLVVAAQRAEAADTRATAVLAIAPKLPHWQNAKPRDYMIVLDASQSMTGERWTRAKQLASAIVTDMDRRDRFSLMTCDSDCRKFGDVRSPSPTSERDAQAWLDAQTAGGATDVVESIRSAQAALDATDRERWVLYIGDGFASTGFRRPADVAHAIGGAVNVSTIGIGGDADALLLQAAARGGGGSYLAWTPGERVGTAAIAALDSTYGAALKNATVELPTGLADVAPSTLPTLRAGDEVLLAARAEDSVRGDVIVRGTVAGQPFEQRYPLDLVISTKTGNGFVPRLWASLAIDQLEAAGAGADRSKIVALSQAYGVMSRETSLLVLESPAMFDAFGVDRHVPTAKWTGEEDLDEVASSSPHAIATRSLVAGGGGATGAKDKKMAEEQAESDNDAVATKTPAVAAVATAKAPPEAKPITTPRPAHDRAKSVAVAGHRRHAADDIGDDMNGYRDDMVALRRTWIRVPAISAYGSVSPSIAQALGDAERALQQNPDSREKHRALVQTLAFAGELDRAKEVTAKWIDRDQLDPQALGYQADLLGRAGDRDQALRTLAGLVDLDADRPALHERMVRAYEQIGKLSQACSHRIALAAISAKDAKLASNALRCLRDLGRQDDAELIASALPDDATRAAAEKAALIAPIVTKSGDLVVDAHWDHGADLDISLIAPDGSRVSWMGASGRNDATVSDATSTEHERLVVGSLRKGNYLVELTRASAATGSIRGTLEVTALGSKRSLPFELRGAHAIIGRVAVSLEEHLEEIGSSEAHVSFSHIADEQLSHVIMARSPSVRQCYETALGQNPSLGTGRVALTIAITQYGGVQLATSASAGFESIAECAKQQLSTMHSSSSPAGTTLHVALAFTR